MEVLYVAFAFLVGWGFGRSERGCCDDTFREGPTRTQVKWYGSNPDNPMRAGSNGPPHCPRPRRRPTRRGSHDLPDLQAHEGAHDLPDPTEAATP